MGTEKKDAVTIRQEKQKEVLVEELRKRPIVQGACQKVGIGRATFYRWRKDDAAFAAAVDEAVETGAGLVNDMAESQLMTAIREGNLTAVIFWLKHHHRAYATKVELLAPQQQEPVEISDTQKEIIRQSVALLAEAAGGETGLAETEANSKPKNDGDAGKNSTSKRIS
ncbi:MAG: phBC6A51 family helix-turn-helix protein [Patescibacteria group bacterium]|nr:MAG: phBC6A51 family helix-turn-helix protein [Patescibacteria group bacterium]